MMMFQKKERTFSLFALIISIFLSVSLRNFAEIKKRVVSVSPAVTETIYYFGYGDTLLARTDYCQYPEEVKEIQSIGNMFNPNLEKIVYQKPDYVIFQSHFDGRTVRQMEKMGIKVLGMESPKNIREIFQRFEKILNIYPEDEKKIQGEKRLKELKEKIEKIIVKGKSQKKSPKIFFYLGSGHLEYTAGKDTFIDDIIEKSGGSNIVKEKGWTYPLEALLIDNPDYIIASRRKWEEMKNSSRYKNLTAVKEEKVILLEEEIINLPTPRALIMGLESVQKAVLEFNQTQ
ncbi:MAG: helical backbone metal receptor [Fusobacteriaceae bacterium]